MQRLRGRRVRLALSDPVGTDAASTRFPTGRLVGVESDYVALDRVAIAGVPRPELGVLAIGLSRVVAVSRPDSADDGGGEGVD